MTTYGHEKHIQKGYFTKKNNFIYSWNSVKKNQ